MVFSELQAARKSTLLFISGLRLMTICQIIINGSPYSDNLFNKLHLIYILVNIIIKL